MGIKTPAVHAGCSVSRDDCAIGEHAASARDYRTSAGEWNAPVECRNSILVSNIGNGL